VLAEPREPGTFGHGAQQARGPGLGPSTRAGQRRGMAAAAERGAHAGQDSPAALRRGAQAACDLANEVSGPTESRAGWAPRFALALGLFWLACVAFLGVETPA
jgi:hypothetical protein